jgi:hypothetical protein
MADRENGSVNGVETRLLDQPVDRPVRDACREELSARDTPALSRGDRRNSLVTVSGDCDGATNPEQFDGVWRLIVAMLRRRARPRVHRWVRRVFAGSRVATPTPFHPSSSSRTPTTERSHP